MFRECPGILTTAIIIMVTAESIVGVKRARPESSSSGLSLHHCDEKHIRPMFDQDILDCNICTEPLASPIFQCANGHVVCSKCCRKLHNVCPSCSRPTGTIRNLALENLIESLRIKCKYWEHGCDRLLKFTEQKVHERQCVFVPIRCPIDMCQFKGPENVYLEHFQCEHDMEPKSFNFGQKFTLKVALDENKVLLLKGGGRLFLFHSEKTNLGQLYYVSQFGMFPPHQDQPFSYKLEISDACTTATYFMERSSTYSMESFCLPTREERVESFLLVPDKMNEATVVLDVSGGRH